MNLKSGKTKGDEVLNCRGADRRSGSASEGKQPKLTKTGATRHPGRTRAPRAASLFLVPVTRLLSRLAPSLPAAI